MKYLCVGLFAFSYTFVAQASHTLSVNVVDTHKKPLENLVVYIEPVNHTITSTNSQTLEIGQKNKSFIPYISVIQLGNDVIFNNQDNITHHIYSPVGENKFSFKVRSGQQIIKHDFNKAGEVSMGCNIHDWMSGYMLIVNTPYYAKSNNIGNTKIIIEKSGLYKIIVWHPQMNETDNRITKEINVDSSMEVTMQLSKPMNDIPSQESEDDFDFLSDY